MHLFLGYDPGGKGNHGVVSVRITSDGTWHDLQAKCLSDATEVRDWLGEHPSAVALGIDTLLAWSWRGGPPCDSSLRNRYNESGATDDVIAMDCDHCADGLRELFRVDADPERRNSDSVVAQNSLRSAMTLNGALVAMAAREDRPEFPLVESHPKLLLRAAGGIGPERDHLVNGYRKALRHGRIHRARRGGPRVHQDHKADAFIAEWCASRWFFERWRTDLYDLVPSENYYFPAGPACYPWPEPVGSI